ncbi:MAG TPA: UDP-N-acetylmuramate dehydrogenase [Limnochordales bacterium]
MTVAPPVSRWAKALRAAGLQEVVEQAPLAAFTAFRIGGPADLLVFPHGVDQLRRALEVAWELGVPVTVIGQGSNLLVSDQGVEGMVLRLGRGLARVEFDGQRVRAQAGTGFPSLAWQAADRELGGLEFGVMIPGTMGGAVVMNAGAHHRSIGPRVRRVRCFTRQGREEQLEGHELAFGYRFSLLQGRPDLVVAEVELELEPRPRAALVQEMERFLEVRRRTQPLGEPGAGSIFKNPPGDFAGRLIERAGLKGWRRGDVEVSPVHANFIVNKGSARCLDVLRAIRMVQEAVQERFGVTLELEVRLLGRFSDEEREAAGPNLAAGAGAPAAPALPAGSDRCLPG